MRYLTTITIVSLTAGPRIAAMLKTQDGAVVRIVSNNNKIITDTKAAAGKGGWLDLRGGTAAVHVRHLLSMQYAWRLDTLKASIVLAIDTSGSGVITGSLHRPVC